MDPSCPLRTARCIPQAKFPRKPYNISFIDQVCSVKMAGYRPPSFLASLWTQTLSRSINTQEKELGQYPAILTSHWVNNPQVQVYLESATGYVYLESATAFYGEIPAHPFRQCTAHQNNLSQQLQFSHRSCQTKPDPWHFSANNIINKRLQLVIRTQDHSMHKRIY